MKLYWKARLSIYLRKLLQLHAHAYAIAGTLIHYALLKPQDKKHMLNKYRIFRVTNGMTVHM